MAALSPPTECAHCGNRSPMPIQGRLDQLATIVDDEASDFSHEEGYVYELLSCPVCGKVNLARRWVHEFDDRADDRRAVIYPAPPQTPTGLPDSVKAAWLAASKLRHGDGSAYATALRRVLDAVCHDRRAPGKQLFDRLRQLAAQEAFPPNLTTIADALRKLGNIGAHAGEAPISGDDNRQLEALCLIVLGHIYDAPPLAARAAGFARRHGKG